ncbi:transposase family protein [Azospirillum argentinense]
MAAQLKHSHAYCPSCQRPSQSVHSRYHRHSGDLPSLGNAVHINLLVRRFYCHNPVCPRRTFAEPVPEVLPPRALSNDIPNWSFRESDTAGEMPCGFAMVPRRSG